MARELEKAIRDAMTVRGLEVRIEALADLIAEQELYLQKLRLRADVLRRGLTVATRKEP